MNPEHKTELALEEIKRTQSALLQELKEVKKTNSDIVQLLGGDWRDPKKPGIVHTNAKMMEEIYSPDNGILLRVGKLEITKKEAMAYGAGAAFVISCLFAFVAYIVLPAIALKH